VFGLVRSNIQGEEMSTATEKKRAGLKVSTPKDIRAEELATPTDLTPQEVQRIVKRSSLIADAFALYTKTKNFHWHLAARTSVTTTCF